MEIKFLEIAQVELDDAVEFYNSESPELGDLFLVEVLHALERIGQLPQAWQPFTSTTRRCLLRRFPYGIMYQATDEKVLVVAIANLHRKPDYWKDRIKKTT